MTDEKTLYERKTIVNSEGCQLPVGLSEAVTLRDKFAMAALTGIMANHETWGNPQDRSEQAYGLADAMLEARK
jgi:hypothetical protein